MLVILFHCFSSSHLKYSWYFSTVLTKFVISRQILIKIPNIKFHWNPASGIHADTYGRRDGDRRTDGHDDGNKHFSGLGKRA